MSETYEEDQQLDKFTDAITDTITYVSNEVFLLTRMEEFFSPKPAKLWSEKEQKMMHDKLDKAVEQMGGAPRFILRKLDDHLPEYDTYPDAALNEVITAFYRARKSVCRAHLFMIGSQMQRKHPEWLNMTENDTLHSSLSNISENAFWEHAETGYIRLASYWDRVGQVLDFAYFRIRQFDRDGFSAVIDRIRTNVIQMNTNLGNSGSWKAIRTYQTSEKEDGLKWLLRRRNITIHSLHLRAQNNETDEYAFKPMYNHLEEKLSSHLSPRTPYEEVVLLHTHLNKAASLFKEILNIIEYSYYLNKK